MKSFIYFFKVGHLYCSVYVTLSTSCTILCDISLFFSYYVKFKNLYITQILMSSSILLVFIVILCPAVDTLLTVY